jgi:glycosyltransferase involved in cell wall biosynthesis
MVSKPKVCILTETYYPVIGGGETQARALANELVENGFDVIVLTRRTETWLKKVECYGSINVYRQAPTGHQHFMKWGLLVTSLLALFKLRQQYDLILVSGFRVVGVPAVIMGKLLSKICILKADNNGEMSGAFFSGGLERFGFNLDSIPFRIVLWMRNQILHQADSFVAISTDIINELVLNGVRPPSKIVHIPNSVDIDVFHPVSKDEKILLRNKLHLPDKQKFVIYTGRLVSYKGLPLLLRVWQRLVRDHLNTGLLLVGGGSMDIYNCEEELKDYVKSQRLQGSVFFCREVQNVHEYLQASDIFVFPTQREAFGISLIEAMACGLPVISTPVGGLKDILKHEQNALIVKPGCDEMIYEALDKLLKDDGLSLSLGEAALKTVEDKYSVETVTQEYISLFRNFYPKRIRGRNFA